MKKLLLLPVFIGLIIVGCSTSSKTEKSSSHNPPHYQYITLNIPQGDSAVVEDMPHIVGGMRALQKNVKYPEVAVQHHVQGLVIFLVTIDKKGKPVAFKRMSKRLGYGCESAVKSAICQSEFTPGTINGKPAAIQMAIPVSFELKKQ